MTNGVAESVAQQPDSAKRPFGMRDKIGYLFGDFGNDVTFILQMMFFMLFYTNVVGIQPGHVGLLFLVARLVDGFTDVGMGILVDRLPVKPGGDKFKRWIKYIAIPVAGAGGIDDGQVGDAYARAEQAAVEARTRADELSQIAKERADELARRGQVLVEEQRTKLGGTIEQVRNKATKAGSQDVSPEI